MDSKNLQLLLRPEEVSQITGWCRSKVYQDIASGRLPGVRNGRSVRIPRSALLAWIDRNTTGGEGVA